MKGKKIIGLVMGLVTGVCLNISAEAQEYLFADVMSLTNNALVSSSVNLNLQSRDGLQLLPYYIRVQFPENNFTAWGIQLYTDNADGTWTPLDGIYGGVRGITNQQQRIPLYWQVYAEPQSNTVQAGGLGIYPETLRYWGSVVDRNDFSVANTWNNYTNLMNRTVVNYNALGYFPVAGRMWQRPPVYVYLGMDVASTLAAQSFHTTLRMDLYNLGIPADQAGYATPNPFTPVTGQRTRFNFFVTQIDAPFVIRIYNVRGRHVRRITNTREWDGRNERGELVEGGLYIYQIEAENRRVSGTVVVIK